MMKQVLVILAIFILINGCGDDDGTADRIIDVPAAVELIFPFENSECNEGTNLTETESTVLFEWRDADNTDEYELVLSNLNSRETGTITTADSKIPIVLQRATPYSWYVTSKSNETDSIAQSETWKFYNAGDGITSYSPFPAEVVFPSMSSTVSATSGSITLDWNGDDVDNDIIGYEVFFGTSNPPSLLETDVQPSELTVGVTSGMVHYWSIISIDSHGNRSESGVFQFKVE